MRHARLVLPTPMGPSTTMKRCEAACVEAEEPCGVPSAGAVIFCGESLIRSASRLVKRPEALGRDASLERGHSAEPGDVEVRGDIGERIQNPVALHYPGVR